MKSGFHKEHNHETDRPTIFPHSGYCYYPACQERRVHSALFCAGHELHWRANYTVPSETGHDHERKEFFESYWTTAAVETREVLRVAGVPAPQEDVILRKIAIASEEFYSTQQPGDDQHLPVSHKVKDGENEFIEDRIGSGLANGHRLRARHGGEGATGLSALHDQTPGEVAAEIASALNYADAIEADDDDDDHNNEQQQRHIGHVIYSVCSHFAATDPTSKSKSEPSK